MHGHERHDGDGDRRGKRRRAREHLARQHKAREHGEAAGKDATGAAELEYGLRVGQPREPIGGADHLKHQHWVGKIVVAREDRVDLADLVGLRA